MGVAGGVRDTNSGCVSASQEKVRMEVGVASGLGGRSGDIHRWRPAGRLELRRSGVTLNTTHSGDVTVTEAEGGGATDGLLPVQVLVRHRLPIQVSSQAG